MYNLNNKKRMQKIFLFLFVGVLGVLISQQMQETPIVDDVLLENVEALANLENKLPTYCEDVGSVVCPITGKGTGAVYEGYSLEPDEENY